MALAPGSQLGPYQIVSRLGEGGMGEVYRARDGRLGRDVALKLLPSEVTREAGRLERFDREARAIAALNHPHIVTIYSTEEANGVRFLTMELVEGVTLSEIITPGGVAIARFFDIAMPLADALAAAHQKQITHRDLKPANVMISHDGRVKVLDFGLARMGGGDGADVSLVATRAPVTRHGVIVGTMPYMSPEQVEGTPLDTRSDLFSLGVLFYELLTGDRPFHGASSPALMSAILRDTPAPISARRASVPDALAQLVSRCLEKRREDRIQTARDVYNELRRLHRQRGPSDTSVGPASDSVSPPMGSGSLSDPRQSAFTVTVLSWQAAAGEAAAFAEGLTQSIVVGLSRFQYLRVLTRAVAREDVTNGYALQASVRIAGGVVRAVMQLTDAPGGATVWAETFDRDLQGTSVFSAQDDLAATIVATVADPNGALVRSMSAVVRGKPAEALTPYEAVLRRFAYLAVMSPQEHALVREALEKTVEREPAYAPAWAALAQMYVDEYSEGYNARPAPLERARAAVDRAIEIDRASHPAHVALALIGFFTRDLGLFRAASERALALNPFDTASLALLGALRAYSGERQAGLAQCARARALHPHHPGLYWMADIVDLYIRREYEQALALLDRVNMPAYPNALLVRAALYAQLGRIEEGRALMRQAEARSPGISGIDSAPYLRWFTSEQIARIQEAREKLAVGEG